MEDSGVDDYRDINRANWDERAPAHAASPDDNLRGFLDDPAFISEVVRFDRPLLGEVSGLRGGHLQCHIDTISLSRLGARMTGLDFSPFSIEHVRALAARTGDQVNFVESDVYEAVAAAMHGDELVPRPRLGYTRAITVNASPETVWQWRVQIGQGRGGLYSFDGLENLARCNIHSVDRIVGEHQQLSVGDLVRAERHPLYPAPGSGARASLRRRTGGRPPREASPCGQ